MKLVKPLELSVFTLEKIQIFATVFPNIQLLIFFVLFTNNTNLFTSILVKLLQWCFIIIIVRGTVVVKKKKNCEKNGGICRVLSEWGNKNKRSD